MLCRNSLFPGQTVPPAPISRNFELAVRYAREGCIGQPLKPSHLDALKKLGTVSDPAHILSIYCEITGLGRQKTYYNLIRTEIMNMSEPTSEPRLYKSLLETRYGCLTGKLHVTHTLLHEFILFTCICFVSLMQTLTPETCTPFTHASSNV